MRITQTSSPAKSGVPVGNVPAVTGTRCFRASDPARASTSTIGRKRPPSMARPSVVLYQSVFPVSPPNAEPLLFAGGRECVHDLGEAVRPGVQDRGLRLVEHDRDRREDEDQRRDDEQVEGDELDLGRLDLLAQVLGRPTPPSGRR